MSLERLFRAASTIRTGEWMRYEYERGESDALRLSSFPSPLSPDGRSCTTARQGFPDPAPPLRGTLHFARIRNERCDPNVRGTAVARYEQQTFRNATIVIDGHQFIGCRFESCTMEYQAVAPPTLLGCHFEACRWSFTNHAGQTIQFLMALYANGDPMLQGVVEQTLTNIRNNDAAPLQEHEVRPLAN